MPRREIIRQVALGDDPGAFADNAAQMTAVPTGATAADNAYVAQLRAALEDPRFDIDTSVFAAIDSTATSLADVTDAEIVTYLQTDDADTRTLLRNVLSISLSEGEMAVLKALATGADEDDLVAALTAAGFTDDAADDEDYWSKVVALIDRYNTGNIKVAMNGGSIDSRGDGIRAYYATANDNNGAINVSVAEGASVTGGKTGIYVANAGEGLRIQKKYAPQAMRMLADTLAEAAGEDAPGENDLIPIGKPNMAGDAIETPYLNQLVTVAGMVTGGTDAAVHLNGGGVVIVEKGGMVLAGSSGVGILVNDPGPAHAFIDGTVKGKATGEGEAPATAAVHLSGGGSVIVGLNAKVEANGATNAIQGGDADDGSEDVDLTWAVADMYRDSANAAHARVDGDLGDKVTSERYQGYMNGIPSGYSKPVERGEEGDPDLSGIEERPKPPAMPETPRTPAMPETPRTPAMPETPRTPAMTPFSCEGAGDGRCRMYEALPSMLVAMNDLPSYAERMSAARDGNGGWARVETARGEWQAKKATMSGKVAYDHHRNAARVGVDFALREDVRMGPRCTRSGARRRWPAWARSSSTAWGRVSPPPGCPVTSTWTRRRRRRGTTPT